MRPLWIAGAALMGVVVVKLFLVDLSNIGGVERIVSFIGVGLLMLLIGYVSPVPPRMQERPNEIAARLCACWHRALRLRAPRASGRLRLLGAARARRATAPVRARDSARRYTRASRDATSPICACSTARGEIVPHALKPRPAPVPHPAPGSSSRSSRCVGRADRDRASRHPSRALRGGHDRPRPQQRERQGARPCSATW